MPRHSDDDFDDYRPRRKTTSVFRVLRTLCWAVLGLWTLLCFGLLWLAVTRPKATNIDLASCSAFAAANLVAGYLLCRVATSILDEIEGRCR